MRFIGWSNQNGLCIWGALYYKHLLKGVVLCVVLIASFSGDLLANMRHTLRSWVEIGRINCVVVTVPVACALAIYGGRCEYSLLVAGYGASIQESTIFYLRECLGTKSNCFAYG